MNSSNPNSHAQPATADDPALAIEVAELTLAIAVRHAAISSLWNLTAIGQPLNVLSRSAAPLPTKAALLHLPHIDLDTATKLNEVGLLRLMLAWSTQPGGRPIYYTHPMSLGMRAGSIAALGWWLDESGLCVQRDLFGAIEACKMGRLDVLQWWKARQFLGLDPRSDKEVVRDMATAVCAATQAGHVDVLDWLWDYLPEAQAVFSQVCDLLVPPVMETAAQSGQVAVVEWWIEKCKHESIGRPPLLVPVLLCALRKGCVPLLDWCRQHPHVVEQYAAGCEQNQVRDSSTSALALAVCGNVLDWIDLLGIVTVPAAGEHAITSDTACGVGNVDALKWLRDKGWLVGSRLRLLCSTTSQLNHNMPEEKSVLQTLQWIHEHVELDLWPKEADAYLGESVYGDLCALGYVRAVDWLHSHGYQLDDRILDSYFQDAMDGHPNVLEWLAAHSGISEEQLTDITECMPWDSHSIGIWKWCLARVGPLDAFAVNFSTPSFYVPSKNPDCAAILQLWLDSGASLDHSACINSASIGGNVAVLDWFLHTLKVRIEHFVSALTKCVDLQIDLGRSEPSYSYQANALLWWWTYIPQVRGVQRINWRKNQATVNHPIKAHLLRSILKISHFPLPDAASLSGTGNVAMLMYLCKDPVFRGGLLMGPSLKFSLSWARERKQEHVIEWWTTRSGIEMPEGWENMGK